MIITDHDLSVFICQAYKYRDYLSITWDRVGGANNVSYCFKLLGASDAVLVLPGTDTGNLHDVLCDLDMIPAATDISAMGLVHAGFEMGIPSVISEIAGAYRIATATAGGLRLHITGHSLGAARGNLLHERMVCQGFDIPDDPVFFGEPRSTISMPIDAVSYINGCDPIHGLPPYPYCARPVYRKLSVKPPAGHRWGPLLGWHDMRLYEQGLRGAM